MEVKEKSKKRELIKSIAIVFLVILLILTFFSNTFMNYSLPEVATKVVTSGTINTRIRGTGTVEPTDSYDVILDQTREVRTVCVKRGDTVEQGDLLFVLGDMESEELKRAQQDLRDLEIAYQRQILEFSSRYASDDMDLRVIREALEKAIEKRDANQVTDAEISYAKGDLAAAEAELRQVKLMIDEMAGEGSSDVQEQVAELDRRINELESSTIKELSAAIQDRSDQITELNNKIQTAEASLRTLGTGTDWDIQEAKQTLDDAQIDWEKAWAANLGYLQQYRTAFGSLGNSPHAFSSSEQVSIERQLSNLKQAEDDAKRNQEDEEGGTGSDNSIYLEVSTAYRAVLGAQNALEKAQAAYDRILESKAQDIEKTRQELQKEINADRTTLSETQQKLAADRDALSSAQLELSLLRDQQRLAQDKSSSASAQLKSYQSRERELNTQIGELTEALDALTAKKDNYEAALEEVKTRQRELEQKLSGNDIDKQLNNLTLQTAQLNIEQKRQEVARLQENTVDTEVKAKVSGVISSINVTAGKETSPGQAMATIDVVDRGYTIQVSVTNEQAKQVKVGDSAEVVNTRWGSEIDATLEAINPDPSAPGQRRMLVFRLSGDVDAGSSITLSIGQRSTVSDTVVPKSALREDTNGKFVLVITSKSTPLGNRYTATRVDVQVIAEDDSNAAVSGVAANDYVITTSSRPIDPGSLVRMVENP